MKDRKACPKWAGTDIYCTVGMSKSGERSYIPISSWSKLFFDIYLCATCGYIEEYVREEDLKNEKIQSKLKENWRKL